MLSDQIRQYNSMEETLKSTLIVAQTTAEQVALAARQKGDNIIKDAQLKAGEIINDAHKDVENIKVEYENLSKDIFIFKSRYKSFMESQLLSLEDFYSNIDREQGKKDFDNLEEVSSEENK